MLCRVEFFTEYWVSDRIIANHIYFSVDNSFEFMYEVEKIISSVKKRNFL